MQPEVDADARRVHARRERARHPSRRTYVFEPPKPFILPERLELALGQEQEQEQEQSAPPLEPPPPQQQTQRTQQAPPRTRIGRNGEELPHLPPPQARKAVARMNKDGKVKANNRNRNCKLDYVPPPQILPPVRAPSPAELGLKLVKDPSRTERRFNPFARVPEPAAGNSNGIGNRQRRLGVEREHGLATRTITYDVRPCSGTSTTPSCGHP